MHPIPVMNMLSFAWRGPAGVGKRTQLLQFLEKQALKHGHPFKVKQAVWYLTKPSNGSADPDEEDEDGGTSKTIPYEESAIHMGFDVARMSMSDKIFLQSILTRWTGQQDVTLQGPSSGIATRYLVLYHAHYLTDESTLQLQEALEQSSAFAMLLTTELPVCPRLRDMCLEIPVSLVCKTRLTGISIDRLLANYVAKANLPSEDVWALFFQQTMESWSTSWSPGRVQEVRNWIYLCLQRNLRWTDVIRYWISTVFLSPWITPDMRKRILRVLWRAESGSGWVLVTSYRIPILWETVHLQLARTLYLCRNPTAQSSSTIADKGSVSTV
jgi:hypothetical protein